MGDIKIEGNVEDIRRLLIEPSVQLTAVQMAVGIVPTDPAIAPLLPSLPRQNQQIPALPSYPQYQLPSLPPAQDDPPRYVKPTQENRPITVLPETIHEQPGDSAEESEPEQNSDREPIGERIVLWFTAIATVISLLVIGYAVVKKHKPEILPTMPQPTEQSEPAPQSQNFLNTPTEAPIGEQ